MNTNELNEYLADYLGNEKAQGAIMLTAPWGTGKSYYIKNKLCPYLEDNGLDYALVSLYGLKDLSELSKNLYIEIRASIFNKKSEKVSAVKIAGKTIIKGIASFFGVDLSQNDEDWQKLYESIDLTNRLIIFEDLERSSIDIVEFMGYVNNLCEQDNVKVLLVANEEEIIKRQEKKNINYSVQGLKFYQEQNKNDNNVIKIFSNNPVEYKSIKEKTVCETIRFYVGFNEPIKQIMESFENGIFNELLKSSDEVINEIINIMASVNNFNLRSFIYACQKTTKIFNWSKERCNLDFYKSIFYSIIAFCLRLKMDSNLNWTDDSQFSTKLSVQKYPLHKFCFNYIKNYEIDKNALMIASKAYEQDILEKQKNKELIEVLQPIYNYYDYSECEVNASIKRLSEYTQENSIPVREYGQLSHFLVYIKGILNENTDIDKCLENLVKNIQKGAKYQENDFGFYMADDFENKEQENMYLKFKNKVLNNAEIITKSNMEFDYSIDNFDKMINEIEKNRSSYMIHHKFAALLNPNKFISLMEKCSSKQIRQIGQVFGIIYSFSNLYDFYLDDKNNLISIKNGLELKIKANVFDKIQKKQMELFIDNLEHYIKLLDRE